MSSYDPPESPRSVGWTEPQHIRLASQEVPLALELGGTLGPVDIECECYGRLNAAKDNAILVCHALTGDAHAAGWDARADADGRGWRGRKPGWWDGVIGPGKAIDTDRWFVLCPNVIGSCYGSTGPSSTDPSSGKPYGLRFPLVTIGDWVRVQALLLDELGIERLHAVLGGSLGGQQALEWALRYPERVARAGVLAAAHTLSSQGLGFNAVGRHAIINDPNFQNGDYYDSGRSPDTGLAIARMLGHITYLSDESMHEKFGRRPQDPEAKEFGFGVHFQVESYLDYQGRSFVNRHDANSYLYLTRAMDFYDAAERWGDGDLNVACSRIRAQTMVMSFSSDWLYTPRDCRAVADAISAGGQPLTYIDVPSQYGHDAFLVEEQRVTKLLAAFLRERPV
ncbi:MAG: homoserine O-acetyltransferase MetX [Planctomycetota bacterium]